MPQQLLGLDVGTVRVGVAVLLNSHPRAQPLGVFKRAQNIAQQKIGHQ
jgi:RNase H-fold protein (predicted Holliday junction resolvase)